MLNLLYDFIPVILFFVTFKLYGIYVATTVGIVATALQVITTRIFKKRFDKQQIITFVVFLFFGGMTLYFHNPIFVKWKPTIVFWIFGLVLLGGSFIGKKNLVQRMMEKVVQGKAEVPRVAWKTLNIAWISFFALMGAINIYVAYSFSTDTWVNFKLYGILILVLLFSFLQGMYLARYIEESS